MQRNNSETAVQPISARFSMISSHPCYPGGLRYLAILLLAAFATAAAEPVYVGAQACAKCHADVQRKWQTARHSKMVQPANSSSVQGDFSRREVVLRGDKYLLGTRSGVYYITESRLTGKPVERRIDYTLGNRRIQHYLTTLPDGRIIVLPPSWDILRKQWFHNFDIGDPDESGEVEVQLWNKNCYSCHVSQEEKNFNTEKAEYKTAWLDFGVNCERCHGPASTHVADPRANGILVQTRLDPARNTAVCAQCHSFRDIFIKGYAAGDDYYDHFIPILEFDQPVDKDPAYWPDGRTRRFSNDAIGFWQSRCFLKGSATCLSCHADAHDTGIEKNPQLRPDRAEICTSCHAAIGKAVSAHTHHAESGAGSSCVECHMPRTVLSIKAQIRDHSMSVPVPENTARHSIPNACNECHKDKDAAWAGKRMDEWWGSASRRKLMRRADAFAKARAGNSAAIGDLMAIVADSDEGPLARANALGWLSHFNSDPRVLPLFEWALGEPDPLLRAIAALRIKPTASASGALTRALGDKTATVRLAAAVSLTGMGVRDLPGEDGKRLARARELYIARAELNSDDAEQQLAAGRFFLLTGDAAKASDALRNSLKLNPALPEQYFLAYACAQQGKYAEARTLLQAITTADPQYANAQSLLKAIEGRLDTTHP